MTKIASQSKQTTVNEPRNWPYTVLCLLVSGFLLSGAYASWKYLQHDLYLVVAVILPAVIVGFCLIFAAFNGRKSTIKRTFHELIDLVYFWQ